MDIPHAATSCCISHHTTLPHFCNNILHYSPHHTATFHITQPHGGNVPHHHISSHSTPHQIFHLTPPPLISFTPFHLTPLYHIHTIPHCTTSDITPLHFASHITPTHCTPAPYNLTFYTVPHHMLHITAHYAPHTTTLHHHSCITSSHSTLHNGNIPHHSSILIHQSHIPHHMVTHSTPHHILNHTTLHIHSTSQKRDITISQMWQIMVQ